MSSGADAWVNWTLNYDGDELAWLAIDCPGRSANALSIEVMQELGSVVDELSKARPRGVILYSIKPSGFIVGADIGEFKEFTDPAETAAMVREVHQLFNRIERFEFPTVAKIHGNCLGGGLELALACRVRVALDEPQTRLGLPEILLGIHPGFAGTVRAVERAGAPAAMDLMLTGRSVDARRAQRMGLIDRAVPARHLDRAARELALQPPLAKKPAFT